MMAVSAASLPTGADWSYEVKWDGYRAIAEKRGKSVTLRSRNLKDLTADYPAVAAAIGQLKHDLVLDGELVAIDENGRPSFQALQHRATERHAVLYYAFDLLSLNGKDLTHQPLEARREALLKSFKGSSPSLVFPSEPLPGTPEQIERAVRDIGLEGVVAKRRTSTYQPGKRSYDWVKVKFAKRQELVIGGYKPAGSSFDSLLVGHYEKRRLMFAGRVRAGFTPALRNEILSKLKPLEVVRCPFANLPSGKTSHWGEGITEEDMEKFRWVAPKLVAEIAFTEWTRDGQLRHSSFVGLRDDKKPSEVVKES